MAPSAHISEIFVSIQGEGSKAGQKHLFVRFAGCNMRCRYCDTEYSLTKVASCRIDYPDGTCDVVDNPLSVERLSSIVSTVCDADPSIEMIAVTGGEPMVQQAFIAGWLRDAPPPVGCLLETNAVISDGLRDVLAGIAVVSADIKLPSNSGEPAQWNRHSEFLQTCAERDGLEVYVKVPVDAGTDVSEVHRALRLVRCMNPQARVFLQPIDDRSGHVSDGRDTYLRDLLGVVDGESDKVTIRPQMHKLMGLR